MKLIIFFFFKAEDGIRDVERSRGLGDVYKRQDYSGISLPPTSRDHPCPKPFWSVLLTLRVVVPLCKSSPLNLIDYSLPRVLTTGSPP